MCMHAICLSFVVRVKCCTHLCVCVCVWCVRVCARVCELSYNTLNALLSLKHRNNNHSAYNDHSLLHGEAEQQQPLNNIIPYNTQNALLFFKHALNKNDSVITKQLQSRLSLGVFRTSWLDHFHSVATQVEKPRSKCLSFLAKLKIRDPDVVWRREEG